ncbi:MAG: hypothetical protein OXG56_08590 [Gammaproteobacteria bacterium]|nr:hypothetical protein [Gammaproteobacteria bacterium]
MARELLIKLESQRESILQQLAEIGDFRPGSLSQRFRRCGKPSCHCAQDDSPGHGPNWILSRKRRGQQSVSHLVPDEALEATRDHLEQYRRFDELVDQLVEVNDALCQAKIRADRRKKTS